LLVITGRRWSAGRNLFTIAVQLPQLFFQPRTSDDAYRYI